MGIRNTHRVGDYLMVDDESGLTHYASEMVRDWDGQMRHKDNLDGRHPQLDVKRVRRDPLPLSDVRPKQTDPDTGGEILAEESDPSISGAGDIFITAEDGITILAQET